MNTNDGKKTDKQCPIVKQQKKGFPSSIKTLWVKPIKIIPKPSVTDLVTLNFAPGFNKKVHA